MLEEISPRIPKNFSPEKYIISFSPDYANLTYQITEEILITSLSENFPYLILNASETNYKIFYLLLYKFDNIADEWVEIGQKNTSVEINTHIYLFSLNDQEKKYLIQDGLYIPIIKDIKKGEKLKLIISLEGKLSPEMSNNALYLCTNYDEKRPLFKQYETLEKEWKENNYNNISTLPLEELGKNFFFKI